MSKPVNDLSQEELLEEYEKTNEVFSDLSSPMPEKKQHKKEKRAPLSRKTVRTILIIALVAVIAVGAFVGVGVYFEYRYRQEQDEAYQKEAKPGLTYFLAGETEPEKSQNEVTSLITEAYYTNDGSLAVLFCFANGMGSDQQVKSVNVSIKNGDDKVIATGYSDDFELVVPNNGTEQLTMYISPEYVKINNDSLSTIAYDVSIEYMKAE